jgi:hypothetical protein
MPAKAKAKGKAVAKAAPKRRYRPRISVPAPAPVRARNEQAQQALRDRPGSLYRCPQCGYPRFVPTAATCKYTCAMPRVRLENNTTSQCDFRTTSSGWRRQARSTLEHETACKAVVHEVVQCVEARSAAGQLADADYYRTLKVELFARATAPAAAALPAGAAAAVQPGAGPAAAAMPLAPAAAVQPEAGA